MRASETTMRLNRFLARAGLGSRRGVEALIAAGRVQVDGEIVREPGVRVDPVRQRVTVDGRVVRPVRERAVWRYYKPRGVVTTLRDERGRPDLAPVARRLPPGAVPVGRLDRASEGLLLWTTDGELALRLTHPRYGVAKRYRVVVQGELPEDFAVRLGAIEALEDGTPVRAPVELLDVRRRASGKAELDLRLREGRYRQLRRILAMLGLEVRRLVRVAEGPVRLAGLRPGELEPVRGRLLERLLAEVGLEATTHSNKRGETPSGGATTSNSP